VSVGVLHHVFAMLFGRHDGEAAHAAASVPEPLTITHAVVAVELALLFAGGVFFLSTPGFEWAASIARDFTVAP
jgi:hypothetical protein